MKNRFNKIIGRKNSRETLPLNSIRTPTQRLGVYAEARLDPIVASYLNAVETLLHQVRIAVVDDEGNSYPNLLPRNFQRQMVKAIIDRIVFGSGVLEATFDRELNITDIGHRPTSSFVLTETVLDENNNIRELTQQAIHGNYNRTRVKLPREKLIILNENPDLCTGSKLEGCITTYVALKNLREILLIGADRALIGVPHFQLPNEPTTEELNRLEDIASSLHSSDDLMIITRAAEVGDASTGGSYKTGYGFELKTTDTSPLGALNSIILAHEKTLATVLLSQFLLLSNGSYALSRDHSDLFIMSIRGILEDAIDDIERDLLQPLAEEMELDTNLYLIAGDFGQSKISDIASLIPLIDRGLLDIEAVKPIAAELAESRFGGL